MSSPYPWYYNVRWIFDYVRPSLENFGGVVPSPRAATVNGEASIARVLFFGDLMCNQGDRVPEISSGIGEIFSRADLVVGNCEAPILFDAVRPMARYYGHFAMAADYLSGVFEAAKIQPSRAVLSVANNHIADQGPDGLRSSIAKIEGLGAKVIGHRDRRVELVDVRGARVGLFAWSHWLNSRKRLDGRSGIWRTETLGEIDFAKERGSADVLIGTPHWEYEFRHFPTASTRASAGALLGGAFDLLVGHHPHVVQPIERVGNKVVAYSLGNLIGPSLARVGWPVRLGALFEVELSKNGIARYEVHPILQRCDREHILAVSLLAEAPEESRRPFAERFELVCPSPAA